MKKEYDGMRHPSIDALLEKIDSKYKLAYVAARRAKIIEEKGDFTLDKGICVKPVGQSLEEILDDKVQIEFED